LVGYSLTKPSLKGGEGMKSRKAMVGMALAVGLVIPLAGCSGGKARISMSKMCAGAGGTWVPASETCMPGPGAGKAAKEWCASVGGIYLPGTGVCEMEGEK